MRLRDSELTELRNLVSTLCSVVEEGQTACIVTVINVRGSAPREAGARMLVTRSSTLGTIGGGQLEYQCIRIASKRIQTSNGHQQSNAIRTFPLGSNCGQCCGGVVDVLFENVGASDSAWLQELTHLQDLQQEFVVVSGRDHGRALVADGKVSAFGLTDVQIARITDRASEITAHGESFYWCRSPDEHYFFQRFGPADFTIAIFGAGHVGSAMVAAIATLNCRIRWVDSRKNVFPESAPENVLMIESATPASEVAAMPPASYFLIMTHDHALDLDICDQVLRRQDAAYCGLIGSMSKRRRFERLMRKQGMSDEVLNGLTCPIGLAGIPGKRPQEIAIATAAELLQIRSKALELSESVIAENVHAI